MYIKSIVIDGFKSYARRTEIKGFDPLFNAITGLNGSGKSNILDSICFLLGITNLSQVRASSLQELVYKNGQAGITKATVSIVFNNMDKATSPHGYEQHDEIIVTRQVVVGGRNKYTINGTNVHNVRAQDMFRSIQLNINNPHFLIMQGRITKVLNMKPVEILSMLEEAAGTRLYETKKEIAQKNIAKKATKLEDINRVINDDITPNLKKLQSDKSSYMEYQTINRDIKILDKIIAAYNYYYKNKEHSSIIQEQKERKQEVKDIQDAIDKSAEKAADLRRKYDELTKDAGKKGSSEKIKSLEDEHMALKKKLTKIQTDITYQHEEIKECELKKKAIQKQMKTDSAAALKRSAQLRDLEQIFERCSCEETAAAAAEDEAQRKYTAALNGETMADDGTNASINTQLIAVEKDITTNDILLKKQSRILKINQEELSTKKKSSKKADTSYKSNKVVFEKAKDEFNKLSVELIKMNFDDNLEETKLVERRNLLNEISDLKNNRRKLDSSLPRLQFDYTDPEPNFNRSRVKGTVANLIRVLDEVTCTGIEVAGGGGLYSIVVDNTGTAKLLLSKGQLKQRYTIIPLNNIISTFIDKRTEKIAKDVGGVNVHTALSLIEFPVEVRNAIQYVFGQAFICKDLETAQMVTYDKRIMKKSVTWSGDSCNPAGTMSGGSRKKTGSFLLKMATLAKMAVTLVENNKRLDELDIEVREVSKTAQRYRNIKQKLSAAKSEMEKAGAVLKNCDFGAHLQEIETLQCTVDEITLEISNAKRDLKLLAERSVDLKTALLESEGEKQREIDTRLKTLKKAQNEAATVGTRLQKEKEKLETFRLDQASLDEDIDGYEGQVLALDANVAKFLGTIKDFDEALKETEEEFNEASVFLKKEKEIVRLREREISDNRHTYKKLEQLDNTNRNKVKELTNTLLTLQNTVRVSKDHLNFMLQDNAWICEENKFFAVPGSTYDFHAKDFSHEDNVQRHKVMNDQKLKLSKCVNMNAITMLNKVEEQYTELLKKREMIIKDKATIMTIINELDIKKNEKLKLAHVQVNNDFGSIFSTLLPGTDARLVSTTSTRDNITILDGLEVKIAFGKTWKESLNELSGGQRSLVALSLILALLLFKPAPLYILDEVDAALDLSHTQNIGQMLRTHFKKSQFIVVSLKDGMFNNANVLFRTRFVEGVSTVTRYAQVHASEKAPPKEKSKKRKSSSSAAAALL